MEASGFIILIIFRVIIGGITSAIANSKGRSAVGWFFGGFFLDLIGLIIVAVLPNLTEQREKEEQIDLENRRLREQLQQERMKNEAFRMHAQTRLDVHDNHLGVDTRGATALPGGGAEPRLLADGSYELEPDDYLAPARQAGEQQLAASGGAGGAGAVQPAATHARQWHYESNGQDVGPVTEQQFIELMRRGQINRHTLVWTEELRDWREAGQVRALTRYLLT